MTRLQRVDIDLSEVASSSELHSVLSDALDFPGWYGCNWNAFWDAITGLVEMPAQLRLSGWEALSERLPDVAPLLRECLTEMNEKHPDIACEVVYC